MLPLDCCRKIKLHPIPKHDFPSEMFSTTENLASEFAIIWRFAPKPSKIIFIILALDTK